MKIPKRWLKYSRSGLIHSTRFVAFKTPLSKEGYPQLPPYQRFTPEDLIQMHPELRLVIDFTYSFRFYDKRKEFEDRYIEHVKIMSKGRVVPTDEQFHTFANAVDDIIRRYPDRGLIGVHCTHGVNRTGYYICRYMIERLGFPPDVAINTFEWSRGHEIERQNYTNDLLKIGRARGWSGGEGGGGGNVREYGGGGVGEYGGEGGRGDGVIEYSDRGGGRWYSSEGGRGGGVREYGGGGEGEYGGEGGREGGIIEHGDRGGERGRGSRVREYGDRGRRRGYSGEGGRRDRVREHGGGGRGKRGAQKKKQRWKVVGHSRRRMNNQSSIINRSMAEKF